MPLTPERAAEMRKKYGLDKTTSTGSSVADRIRAAKEQSNVPANNFSSIGVSEFKPGILSTLGSSLKDRLKKTGETMEKTASGEINPLQTGVRTAGQIAGAAGDVFMGALKGAGKIASVVTPDFIEKPVVNKAKSGGLAVLQSPVGQAGLKALQIGMTNYQTWKKANPSAAADLEAVVNIASLAPIGKATELAGRGAMVAKEAAGDVAGAAAKGVEKSIARSALDEALELTRPILSKLEEEKAKAAGRGTVSGVLKTIGITPSKRELAVAEVAKNLVNKANNFAKNIENVRTAIKDSAVKVREGLRESQAIWNKNLLKNRINIVELPITVKSDRTLLNQADNLKKSILQIAEKANKKTEGLLDVRQEFDNLIEKEFPNIFDKELTPIRQYIRNLRASINDYTEQSIPEGLLPDGSSLKNEWKKQTLLFDAAEGLAERAPRVDTNVLQRAMVAVKNHPVAAITGSSALTAAAITGILSSPAIIATLLAGGTYKVGKAIVTSTALKKTLQTILKGIERGLKTSDELKKSKILADKEALQSLIQKLDDVPKGLSIKDVTKSGLVKGEIPTTNFEGFDDLSTKLLEKLKGRSTVSRQFIEDLTNAPDLKQAERDLIRRVVGETTDSNPIILEARKYKSAEEFVNSKTKLLHGTDEQFEVFDPAKMGTNEKNFAAKSSFFFTDSTDTARSYGKNLKEVYTKFDNPVTIDAKGKMFGDMRDIIDETVTKAKKNGNDGVIIKNLSDRKDWGNYEAATHYAVFDTTKLQTKSQLTDIWNKAQSDTINVKDFANKVKTELLPLNTVNTKGRGPNMTYTSTGISNPKYESINLPDELRGPVANYQERIYESPIKTSAGNVHFSGNETENYFAHTRIEDLPNGTRRVIEAQSDLFQKGRLESEVPSYLNVQDYLPKEKLAEYNKLNKRIVDLSFAENSSQYKGEIAELTAKQDALTKTAEGARDAALKSRGDDVAKLEPYRNTWHERVIREEVKQAAQDGKTKLQFPTGETAMKIEGLGQGNQWSARLEKYENGMYRSEKLADTHLKAGQEIYAPDQGSWIITDVLGDGKFKAVPKATREAFENSKKYGVGDDRYEIARDRLQTAKETFDISGKVDTNNPIYKFYEKEVGKYLKNKYGAQLVTDAQGVKWWEVNVGKEQAKLPVEAFGVGAIVAPKDED